MPEDVRAWPAGLRGPGGSSEAIKNQPFARSISSSRSKSSAMRSALDQDRSPSRLVDETFGMPFANPADIPPGHHPEGSQFQVSGPAGSPTRRTIPPPIRENKR